MSYKSKEVLNSLAKLAADAYIKSKKSLNESIKKTASAEGLAPHQVEYVAGEANKLVWAHNYKTDKGAAYDFPIADPKHIIKQSQKSEPVTKTASVADLDYMLPPSEALNKTASSDGKAVYGFFNTEATADLDRRELRQTLQSRYEKLAHAKERLQEEIIMAQSSAMYLTDKFVKQARELIMQTPFSEREQAMDKVAEFVSAAAKDATLGRELMSKLAEKVTKDGLVKSAGLKAPEEYISENLPATVINGNHELYITIDTLKEKRNYISDCERNFVIVDGTLPVLKEKIRGL